MQRWKVSQLYFLVDGFRQSGFVVTLSAVLRSGVNLIPIPNKYEQGE